METRSRVPTTMQAVRLHRATGPRGLRLDTVPVPLPGAGEALVRVVAAAVTRDELEWPTDRLPAIPSYELSGIVAAIGRGVADVVVGQPVLALTGFERDGAAAEYVSVPAPRLAPMPEGLNAVTGAALTLSGLTAIQGLFEHGGVRRGRRVLVLGALGGVGHLAVQLARRSGADVVGVASRDDPTRVDGPVDVLFDTVGGDPLAAAVRQVRSGGRVVSVAEEPSGAPPGVDARYFVVEPDQAQLVELARLAASGELRVEIDTVFALDDARAAFQRSLARGKRGKVVLRVSA